MMGLNWPGPNQNGSATMGWQPTAEAGELTHGAQVVAAPADSDSRGRDRWRGRVVEDAGGVDTRFEAVGRWETHQGLASTVAHSGGRKPAVLDGASHRGARLVGRRAAQPQCPTRGGGGRSAQNRRHAVHGEAPAEADGRRPRLASGSSSRRSTVWGRFLLRRAR
jgi:hypothetical protein